MKLDQIRFAQGDCQEALEVLEEALQILHSLTADDPNAHIHHLAAVPVAPTTERRRSGNQTGAREAFLDHLRRLRPSAFARSLLHEAVRAV